MSEIDLIGNGEEFECTNPIETLCGHLIGISDPDSLARWHGTLSLYLFDRISESEPKNVLRLIEIALQSLNISKNYSEEAERQRKIEKRKRSAAGTNANQKKNERLEILKMPHSKNTNRRFDLYRKEAKRLQRRL
jgi:hypothetical protein